MIRLLDPEVFHHLQLVLALAFRLKPFSSLVLHLSSRRRTVKTDEELFAWHELIDDVAHVVENLDADGVRVLALKFPIEKK